MKQQIKKTVKSILRSTINLSINTKLGEYLQNQIVNTSMDQTRSVSHKGIELKFTVPNRLCRWRADTFSSKEPETLEWIDEIPLGAIVWDIGANIGLYSVYAAKKNKCKVWAFEPSVFNLELLARNIYLNNLTNDVCIVPFALSDKLGSSKLQLTTTEWGGALSTFGQDFGWDGKAIKKVFEFQTVGLSMEDALNRLAIPVPGYIKIDVDGLEHFILKGGKAILSQINEILIEINDDFHDQADQCRDILTECGLALKEKRHSEMIGGNTNGFQNSYNQIWVRK
jgi:FkbM family methyltransferase